MNLYQYLGSNPLSRRDPQGTDYGTSDPDEEEKRNCVCLCGLIACSKAHDMSIDAATEAGRRFPGIPHNNPADAWRHCYWNCKMEQSWWINGLIINCARIIANAHEHYGDKKGQPQAEKIMDLHNNQVGRDIGDVGGDCATDCQHALDNGKLQIRP